MATTDGITEVPLKSAPVPRRRWQQFSLRALLLGTVLLATLLGFFGSRLDHARRQAAAVAAVQTLGGSVRYDFECQPAAGYGMDLASYSKSSVPPWLLELLGVDFFHTVVYVDLNRRGVDDDDVNKLPNFQNLLGLNLRRNSLGNASAVRIAHYKSLRCLDLSMAEISDEGVDEISKLQSLEVLNLDQTRLTDAGLVHIAKLRNLRDLTISNNFISDEGLRNLAPLARLEVLNVQQTQVTGEALATLSASTSIRELRLDGCPLSDEGAQMIGKLPSIRSVTLRSPRVKSLGQIDWPDSLERVLFDKCQLNDEDLCRLTKCPNLREVSVSSCQVTNDGIKRFRQARPNVNVLGP